MKWYFIFVVFLFLRAETKANDLYDKLITSPQLFAGDSDGLRSNLAQKGLSLTAGYGGESAHNFSGGTKQLTEYTDQWLLGAGIDFEKLGLIRGATAQVMLTERNGQNLGADAGIGNDMLIQEVYGRGQTLHTTDFWYGQNFLNNQLNLKLGRMTVGEDFASFSCDFQNLTFCGAQPGNIVGSYWLNWPTSVWAARLKFNPAEQTRWQIGAYQVNPTYVDDGYAQKYGWTLDNPSGSTGTLIPLEFAWMPFFDRHPGSYKFGVWYNTAQAKDLIGEGSHNQYGAYINFEQQFSGTKDTPGWSVFLNASQADPTTAAVDRQIALGLQRRSAFGRRNDAFGFGAGSTDNKGIGSEYDTEVYYSYAPIASVFLRPNLQYILQPGGIDSNKNAFIAGLKTGVTF